MSCAIVGVHGGPGMDSSYFYPFFDKFDNDLKFYTYDQSADSIDGLTTELENFISKISEKNIFLLGHSFGASIVVDYLAKNNNPRIDGVILISWFCDLSWKEAFSQHIEGRVIPNNYKEQMLEMTDCYFTRDFIEEGYALLDKIRYNEEQQSKIWADFSNRDLSSKIKKINLPILSVSGDLDKIIDAKHTAKCEEFVKYINKLGI